MSDIKWEDGAVHESARCGKYKVLKDEGFDRVFIKFVETGYEKVIKRSQIKTGYIKDPLYPFLFGVGYFGEGEYTATRGGKPTRSYGAWEGMVRRCYDKNKNGCERYSGRGVSVCKEWLNFQNFARWFSAQPNSNLRGFEVDKDIINPSAKTYSEENCAIVPHYINALLTTTNAKRGEFPVGVCKHRAGFLAQCNRNGKRVKLGVFNSVDDAFNAYKKYKLCVIAEKASKAFELGHISKLVLDRLLNIEITKFPE